MTLSPVERARKRAEADLDVSRQAQRLLNPMLDTLDRKYRSLHDVTRRIGRHERIDIPESTVQLSLDKLQSQGKVECRRVSIHNTKETWHEFKYRLCHS